MIKLIAFLLFVLLLATTVVPFTLRRLSANGYVQPEVPRYKLIAGILVLLVVLTMPACGTAPPKSAPLPEVVLIPPAPSAVSIPKETLKPCDPLPKLEERVYTEVEVLQYFSGPVAVYADCRKRQEDAIKILRKAFNVN